MYSQCVECDVAGCYPLIVIDNQFEVITLLRIVVIL